METRQVRGNGFQKPLDDSTCYSSLDHFREIRVLMLHSGNYGDPLCGTLQHIQLPSPVDIQLALLSYTSSRPLLDYEAVSYAWASSEKPYHIKICHSDGETPVPIQTSLYQALQSFRHPSHHRKLCTDAVCINQTDLIEKNE